MSKAFTDIKGRTWVCDVTIAAAKRIKTLVGFDLLQIPDMQSGALEKLVTDVALMVDVIYATVKPQADAKSVSDEEFGEGLAGEHVVAARDAFMEGLTDFFHGGQRMALEKVLRSAKTFETNLTSKYQGQINRKLDELLEKAMVELDKSIATALSEPGTPSTNPQATSD